MAALLNLLTDIEGVAVGHSTDLALGSGVTAIIFDEPAVASYTVLGGAPGGRDTALLDPAMTVGVVDGLVLSGGSAFGLPAARPVPGPAPGPAHLRRGRGLMSRGAPARRSGGRCVPFHPKGPGPRASTVDGG